MDINETRNFVITEIHNLTLDQVNLVKTFVEFLKYQEESSSKDAEPKQTDETPSEKRDLREEFPGLFESSDESSFR